MEEDRLTLGGSAGADIVLNDSGIAPRHISIHRNADQVWILNESSDEASYVNGLPVPAFGMAVADGDKISIGDYTIIWISINRKPAGVSINQTKSPSLLQRLPLMPVIVLGIAVVIGVVALGSRMIRRSSSIESRNANVYFPPEEKVENTNKSSSNNSNTGEQTDITGSEEIPIQKMTGTGGHKLYLQMSEEERNEFIYLQARNISRMMSNREYVFTDDVLPHIKKYVDAYGRRVGNRSTAIWGEDLNFMFGRARKLAPYIIREFNARGAPKVVGLYIPMIESEYRECLTSPVGAKGLFQFMPDTARGYGVEPEFRCDVKKMAPAAAKYIKDRIAEFGSDSMSVALGIAGYNRSPDSVRRDLSDVLNSKNKERSFWTLISNSDKLDRFFQNENIKYVPKFFAAAIVGENPWAFGLQMNPLSTYTVETEQ
jgi:pSer/pThr/pTyr-binding forkhead associated (FHA) protein